MSIVCIGPCRLCDVLGRRSLRSIVHTFHLYHTTKAARYYIGTHVTNDNEPARIVTNSAAATTANIETNLPAHNVATNVDDSAASNVQAADEPAANAPTIRSTHHGTTDNDGADDE